MSIDYTKKPRAGSVSGPADSPAKVTLTKASPAVSLTKQESESGILRVNLNWNAKPSEAGGFLKRLTSDAIDLDLGCLYEYSDGSKGAVQALGNAFRDRHSFGGDPFVWLDGDDRTGSAVGGENLFVDLRAADRIRRVIVFALIYEGAPNWAAANGLVTVMPASGRRFEVRLDEGDPRARMCAVVLLENVGGAIRVSRQMRYVSGHSELDNAYGWGIRWVAGRK